ncbi:plasmid mobilization relaxosome protein MobC [Streptomyces sp. NPDC050095]|uniref:plasmid mobilization relaxosome protein MobC n=1 Tax=unclassified Streptomyces TaxID=2593676 RepID=UPI0034131C98
MRVNDDEKRRLTDAASTVHASLPAFLARSGLAAADDLENTAAAIAGRRELVTELFAARRHLRQVGNNLNQVARALNADERPAQLPVVLDAVARALHRIQSVTDQILDHE